MIRLIYKSNVEFFPKFEKEVKRMREGDLIQIIGFKDKEQLRTIAQTILSSDLLNNDAEYHHVINEGAFLAYTLRRLITSGEKR